MKLNKNANTNILIVGLGLLGGSYAMALKKKGYHVEAITKDQTSVDYALEHGLIDYGTTKVEPSVVQKAELIVFALYPHVLLEWLKENQVKMIQEEEDSKFVESISEIIDANAAAQSETVTIGADTFKDAFTAGLKGLTRMRQPLGKVLMHKNTYLDSLKLKTEDIGYNPQEERFRKGVEGEDSFLGIPVVTTIKDNLVKENELYFFSSQEYFLKFFLLQDATLFMEARADMIHFHTYESAGVGIGNTKGVFKVTLA